MNSTVERFGVQPHSQGDFYPAIVVAYGNPNVTDYAVMFRGVERRGYTKDDAYLVARGLASGLIPPTDWAAEETRGAAIDPYRSGMAPDETFRRVME